MYVRHPGLGLIPAWQFDMHAANNPKINPHVRYPDGVTQQTIQPLGPNYGVSGLASPFDSWAWNNRTLLVGGGVLALGAVVVAGVLSLLK